MSLQVFKILQPPWFGRGGHKIPILQYAIVNHFTKDTIILSYESNKPMFYGSIGDPEMAWSFYQQFTLKGCPTSWLDLLVVRGVSEEQVIEMFEECRKTEEPPEYPDF